jgi:hypothetical protein
MTEGTAAFALHLRHPRSFGSGQWAHGRDANSRPYSFQRWDDLSFDSVSIIPTTCRKRRLRAREAHFLPSTLERAVITWVSNELTQSDYGNTIILDVFLYTFLAIAHFAAISLVPFPPYACSIEIEMRQE